MHPDVRVYILLQGGAIAILTACERPQDFAGVVLIGALIQMNPESATPFKVETQWSERFGSPEYFLSQSGKG